MVKTLWNWYMLKRSRICKSPEGKSQKTTRANLLEPLTKNIKHNINKTEKEIENSMTTSDKVGCTIPTKGMHNSRHKNTQCLKSTLNMRSSESSKPCEELEDQEQYREAMRFTLNPRGCLQHSRPSSLQDREKLMLNKSIIRKSTSSLGPSPVHPFIFGFVHFINCVVSCDAAAPIVHTLISYMWGPLKPKRYSYYF